jgi:hypothetical protein
LNQVSILVKDLCELYNIEPIKVDESVANSMPMAGFLDLGAKAGSSTSSASSSASSGRQSSGGPTGPKRRAVARVGRAAAGADEEYDDEGMENDDVDEEDDAEDDDDDADCEEFEEEDHIEMEDPTVNSSSKVRIVTLFRSLISVALWFHSAIFFLQQDEGIETEHLMTLERLKASQQNELSKGTPNHSVQASDRLMKELRDIYRSQSFKKGEEQILVKIILVIEMLTEIMCFFFRGLRSRAGQ